MIIMEGIVPRNDEELQLASSNSVYSTAMQGSNQEEGGDQAQFQGGNRSMTMMNAFPRVLWEGDSALDAWLSAASTGVAQALLSLPSTFARLGMASGIAFLVMYGLLGCWSCYVIVALYAQYRSIKEAQNITFHNHTIQWHEVLGGLLGPRWMVVALVFNMSHMSFVASIQIIASGSIAYYINNRYPKRTWTIIFGAIFLSTALIPTARNYRMWSFMGILMTTYVGWYLTLAASVHGQVPNVEHTAPHEMEAYFIGAANIIYLFGASHGFTVEVMHAMWKPRDYKIVYLYSMLLVLSFTIPSASAVYWAFGDGALNAFNAFSLLPSSKFKTSAAIAMLMHERGITISFGLWRYIHASHIALESAPQS